MYITGPNNKNFICDLHVCLWTSCWVELIEMCYSLTSFLWRDADWQTVIQERQWIESQRDTEREGIESGPFLWSREKADKEDIEEANTRFKHALWNNLGDIPICQAQCIGNDEENSWCFDSIQLSPQIDEA